jgi:hypothetical protein
VPGDSAPAVAGGWALGTAVDGAPSSVFVPLPVAGRRVMNLSVTFRFQTDSELSRWQMFRLGGGESLIS